MPVNIFPCLWFNGNAREALAYYCSIFENARITEDTGTVVIAEIYNHKLMGLNGGPIFTINPSISFFISCNSIEEIDAKWKLLSDGGKVLMPLNEYLWSKKFGWCQDKFGVNWQLILETMGSTNQTIIPTLMFTQTQAGKAEQAMQLYTSIFPNAAITSINRYEKGEPDTEGFIKHARFHLNNQNFIALDSSGPHQFSFNEAVSFVISVNTQEELNYYWDALIKSGGQESRCGWLKDPFGISWQVVPSIIGKLMSNPDKAANVMKAILSMNKIDIQTLINA